MSTQWFHENHSIDSSGKVLVSVYVPANKTLLSYGAFAEYGTSSSESENINDADYLVMGGSAIEPGTTSYSAIVDIVLFGTPGAPVRVHAWVSMDD